MKLYRYPLSIFILFLVLSCSPDKLNLYPITTLSEGTYYRNSQEIEIALNDVYRHLGRIYDAEGIPSLYGMLLSDNGEVVAQLSGNPRLQPIDRHQLLSDNPRIEQAWDETYNSIFICNDLIEKISNSQVDLDASYRNRMLAEAKVVRAIAYFNLVRAFGAVPLITTPIEPDEAYDYLRVEPNTVYEQIISDLETAKNDLNPSYSGADKGRLTKYGAAALLADIHMTRNNMEFAKLELEFIINSGEFSLDANNDGAVTIDDYLYIFDPATKNCKSSILEAQYMSGVNAANSNHQNAFSPYAEDWKHPLIEEALDNGGGFNVPTLDLAAEFEEGDPRKDITVVLGFTNSSGIFIDDTFTLKYFDPNWWNAGQNFEIIRYADILLRYAEITNDAQYLNMVRDRVGMPHFGSEGYPSDLYPTLALAIEHERRVELGMEMHRFFDLVRTGRAVELLSTKVEGEIKLLFPIPQYAIDVNPGLTQNHPEY